MTAPVRLPTQGLLRWLRTRYDGPVEVDVASRRTLAGGVSGALVDRVGLVVRAGSDTSEIEIVAKRTHEAEIAALCATARLRSPVFPELIDSGSMRSGRGS